ncbi:hypothetical protein A0J61_01902 [Choanephora cucurbitarum]|uniref:Uncharacterized protein n=1 Tax=Choanephora cucurbitarum TaxID=101091 RepID=A0A1C7NLS2_9FUNG|nr:hypothetical protein A0J61_01902 [Choanephora cucurbitarum]
MRMSNRLKTAYDINFLLLDRVTERPEGLTTYTYHHGADNDFLGLKPNKRHDQNAEMLILIN